jgi:hypothetical protein
MAKTTNELSEEFKRLKLDLADVRKSLVDIGKRAGKSKMVAGDRKKLVEIKSAIDQVYKNIK